jgi:hypothetical protein
MAQKRMIWRDAQGRPIDETGAPVDDSAPPTPEQYPAPLYPEEAQTVSGELVAGPGAMGRLPATPAMARADLPPVMVEASRLPPAPPAPPAVEGMTMVRSAPGTAQYGEKLDLTPTPYMRQNGMSLAEARAKGLIVESNHTPQNFSNFHRGSYNPMEGKENAGMGMTGDAGRAATDAATRGERWGSGGSTTRRTGRAQDIIDQVRANRTAKIQSDIRVDEAVRTPQLQTGTYVGQAYVPDGKGGGSVQTVDATTGGGNRAPKPMTPAQAANILKQAAQMRTGDKLKAIAPDPDTADAMENMLRAQGYDVDALKGKKPEDGGQRTEAGGQKPAGEKKYTAAEAAALAPGTVYTGADGKKYRR